jgi:hypothetical protein
MRTILFVVAFAAASLAIGSLPRHSQVTCRTVVRFGRSGFGGPTLEPAWGTSLACPAFVAAIGAVDGVRLSRGEAPLDTASVLVALDDGTVTVPGLIAKLA